MEIVIKAILVKDGMETFTISFLPRHIMARGMMAERFTGKITQIIKFNDGKKTQEFQESRDSIISSVE